MLHTLVQGTMLQQLFHRISMLLMTFIGFLGDSCSCFLHVRQKLLLSTHKLKLSQDVIIHVTKNIFLKFLTLNWLQFLMHFKWPCLEQCFCRSFYGFLRVEKRNYKKLLSQFVFMNACSFKKTNSKEKTNCCKFVLMNF